jgi:hypothetical protein
MSKPLTYKAVELAKASNPLALRICLERVLPPRKDRPINLALPRLEGVADLPQALKAIIAAGARRELTPMEVQTLTGMLETYRKGVETSDHEACLIVLGKRLCNYDAKERSAYPIGWRYPGFQASLTPTR